MADEQTQHIEYSVYTLLAVPPGQENKNEQEKHLTTEDMDAALKQAVLLVRSDKYQKVEVKKKYFEEKTGRTVEMTLRAFDAGEKKDWSIALFLLLALACGAGAFALTFFLT